MTQHSFYAFQAGIDFCFGFQLHEASWRYVPKQSQCYSHSLKIPCVPVFKLNKLVELTTRRTANDAGLNTAIHRDAVSA